MSIAGYAPNKPYLELADVLSAGLRDERDLPAQVAILPILDPALLLVLAKHSETAALTAPKLSWAIMAVADAAAQVQSQSRLIKAKTAWYLARAANAWGKPRLAEQAARRARQDFEALGERGWLAACHWQINDLAWTRPSFLQAADELQAALQELELAGLNEFVPHCQLALSYAQILTGKYEPAILNIELCETEFARKADRLNQARCWMNRASILRRQGRFDDAIAQLETAMGVFAEHDAIAEIPKVEYQIALCHLIRSDSLSKARSSFENAAKTFAELDLGLWQAACLSNLGWVSMMEGQLAEASGHYQMARRVFSEQLTLGLLANNLNDSGKLNLLRGQPLTGIEQFHQALSLYEQLGMHQPAAVTRTNLGEAYSMVGRYQEALHHLELASQELIGFSSLNRLGSCEKFMAQCWLQMGNSEMALKYLDSAASHHREANQSALLPSVHNYRAVILMGKGDIQGAIKELEIAINLAKTHNLRPQEALSRRLFGDALTFDGQLDDALSYLDQAQHDFEEMEILSGQIQSLVSLGNCTSKRSELGEARAAFERALLLNEDAFPEVSWQAYAGLAGLAEKLGKLEDAARYYYLSLNTLAAIRQNFWQPALAGSYFQAPSQTIRQAISLVANMGNAQTVLGFIEVSKATTFLRQLTLNRNRVNDGFSTSLDETKARIHWLQEQLATSFEKNSTLKAALQTRKLRAQLVEMMQTYDTQVSQIERASIITENNTNPSGFDLEFFRSQVCQILGDKWLALDYYFDDDHIICVMLTSDLCQVHQIPATQRLRMALDNVAATTTQTGRFPTQSDYEVLGSYLLYPEFPGHVSPDTFVLIAPHERLHLVPWAALNAGSDSARPLVSLCMPVVVPSLTALQYLWGRETIESIPVPTAGLVIGVSEFNGRHGELPFVRKEIQSLGAKLDETGKVLMETNASWKELQNLKQNNGLAHFAWLHIASHIFPDTRTGRMSGIALANEDIWLDQLRDLSPLPDMVTLSACSGMYHFSYSGDEQVGIPSTCLIGGANIVMGSLWSVQDEKGANFMDNFYGFFLQRLHPVQALALAQRQSINEGLPSEHWAGFICYGKPERA